MTGTALRSLPKRPTKGRENGRDVRCFGSGVGFRDGLVRCFKGIHGDSAFSALSFEVLGCKEVVKIRGVSGHLRWAVKQEASHWKDDPAQKKTDHVARLVAEHVCAGFSTAMTVFKWF